MKIRRLLGFVVAVLGVFVFMTVFDTVRISVYFNQFMFNMNIGMWGTPTDLLLSLYTMVSIVIAAHFATFIVYKVADRMGGVSNSIGVLNGAIIFTFFFGLEQPLVTFFAFGDQVLDRNILTTTPWTQAWEGFGRPEFYAFAVSAPIMVLFDTLYRYITMTGRRPVIAKVVGRSTDARSWRQRWSEFWLHFGECKHIDDESDVRL